MSALPRVCVIGAGSSGITAAKALLDRGISFDTLEMSDRVGGNWAIDNPNGVSSAYRSLHINTSRERMEYSDYPMPKSYPDFPKHTHIARYFNDYVDHFELRERIEFETRVDHADRRDDRVWEVRVTGPRGEETREYDALVVANGHHWDPRWPEPPFPGSFDGVEMHSHHYRDPDDFHGKRIVVLGMGNSAMDIAVESSEAAANTYLAARRGAWIIPKYLFGRPLDTLATNPRVPMSIGARMLERIVTLHVGRPEKFGLPKPDHRMGQAHPTISGRIHDRIQHGKITPRPNIRRLHKDEVEFTDGTRVHADVVIYCTGYKITFPFFDEGFVAAKGNQLRLYKFMFHPRVAGLYFLGLIQPLGAIMPIAERQSQLIARHLTGAYALPSPGAMERDIDRKLEAMRKRYVASKRHTIQVDYDDYMRELTKEMAKGGARAGSSVREDSAKPPCSLYSVTAALSSSTASSVSCFFSRMPDRIPSWLDSRYR